MNDVDSINLIIRMARGQWSDKSRETDYICSCIHGALQSLQCRPANKCHSRSVFLVWKSSGKINQLEFGQCPKGKRSIP